jgi:hypothetical protein
VRILLVEDEPNAARMLGKGLREHAYAVDLAEDGEDALYRTSIWMSFCPAKTALRFVENCGRRVRLYRY